FEKMRVMWEATGIGDYTPFTDKKEWEWVQWLINNANQHIIDEFLKLLIITITTYSAVIQMRIRTQPTFHNKNVYLKLVDQLLTGLEWSCDLI
ncbi:hypothetical protein HD554DRAFT_2006746, partial [Boletus coccyginus]